MLKQLEFLWLLASFELLWELFLRPFEFKHFPFSGFNRYKVFYKYWKSWVGLNFFLVDLSCLSHILWRFIEDERQLSSLVDEILQSAMNRSLEKELMESDVIELIIEKAQLIWAFKPFLQQFLQLCNKNIQYAMIVTIFVSNNSNIIQFQV